VAAATKALTASFGEEKTCSPWAETPAGQASPSPITKRAGFIFIKNAFLKIIGIKINA
jgi:hypothetical protein